MVARTLGPRLSTAAFLGELSLVSEVSGDLTPRRGPGSVEKRRRITAVVVDAVAEARLSRPTTHTVRRSSADPPRSATGRAGHRGDAARGSGASRIGEDTQHRDD
jgi:hypothetical protein